ncbi:MAG: FAD-dependent tricarballylate dehydrogenase TcuA [Halanaeroarchaeum sp.]
MGSNPEPLEQRDYDVVIVGAGMAGLAAGLAATERDVSTAILEKSPKEHRGGHLRFTESFRIPTGEIDIEGTEFDVPDYSASDFYSDIMKVTNMEANDQLAQTLTAEAGPMFEWLTEYLAEQGFDWEYDAPHPGYTVGRTWHDGEQLTDALVDAVTEQGADVYYDAEARELNRDGHGEIESVDAYVDGTYTRFSGDAIVLATGGYEADEEKRTIYWGEGYESMKVRGSRYATGEGIDAAIDAGAKATGQWSGGHMALIDAMSPDVEGGITRIDGYQYGVIVNHDGERFVDEGEDARGQTYAKFGRRIFEQPYHEAFIIVDSKVVDDVAHMGPSRPITADSLEGLANRLDIRDVEQTVETIEAFNEAAEGTLDDYDPNALDGMEAPDVEPRKSNWALPIDEPPFTGYPVTGGATFGYGGVAITPDAEVLNTRDEPIPGLYAAGNSTGDLFYNNYPGGTGLANAAVFGKIAGEEAADYASE